MLQSQKLKIVIIAFVCVTALGSLAAFLVHNRSPSSSTSTEGQKSQSAGASLAGGAYGYKPVSLPDAFITTQSLSALPRDLLKSSVLKDLLTEDFVFYYETNEDRLSLKGTIKRLAYEHDLGVADHLLSYAFDHPAEIAFWKTYDGKLSEFMLMMERTKLTDVMLAISKAMPDEQLSLAEEREIPGFGKTKIYRLNYTYTKDLYFSALKDTLVVFSNQSMELPTEAVLKKWAPMFGEKNSKAKHSLYFSARYLSFGHQVFFPSLKTIKLEFDQQWSLSSLREPALKSANEFWKAAPKSPSLCLSVPIDIKKMEELLHKNYAKNKIEMKALKTPGAICWYGESQLYLPLILGQTEGPMDKESLKKIFSQAVGAFEVEIVKKEAELKKEQEQGASAKSQGKRFVQGFKVNEKLTPDGFIFTKEVSSRYGIYSASKSKNEKQMRSSMYFKVQLAYWKNYLIFSPDDRLVDKAISALNQKYPPVADALQEAQKNAQMIIYPSQLAELLKKSIDESLPASQESLFRESVSNRIFPGLENLKKISAYAVTVPEAEKVAQWGVWTWHPLAQ